MSLTLTFKMVTTVTELTTLTGPSDDAITTIYDQYNTQETLTASTTPPVTKHFSAALAMTAGALTIDLTSLSDGFFATKTFLGLKVQSLKIKAKDANAAVITLTEGASNGYALLGAGWTLDLLPGQEIMLYGNDATPDVASGDRTIDVSGTTTDGLEVVIVAG